MIDFNLGPLRVLWTRHSWFIAVRCYGLHFKSPSAPPVFAERNGTYKPILRLAGHRVFILRRPC